MAEKLVYTDEFGNVYTIEKECGPTIYDVVDELFKPILLAAGFPEQLIENAFGEGGEDND